MSHWQSYKEFSVIYNSVIRCALSTEAKKIQLVQWIIFIKIEGNLLNLPIDAWPHVYSRTFCKGCKKIHTLCCKEQLHSGNTEMGKRNPHQRPPTESGYLIVQMPGLVVILGTPTAEERLVIHLDQLPLRTETEVPKNSEHGRKNKRKNQSQPDSYFHSANNVSWISAAETDTVSEFNARKSYSVMNNNFLFLQHPRTV